MPNKEYSTWRNKADEIKFVSAEFELDTKQKKHMKSFYGKEVDSIIVVRYYDERYEIEYYKDNKEVEIDSITKGSCSITGIPTQSRSMPIPSYSCILRLII
jgi:hypothetical protein